MLITGRAAARVMHRTGLGHVALQWPPDKLLGKPGALDELLQVHPRFNPHLVQHVDQVLCGDLPDGALMHLSRPTYRSRRRARTPRKSFGVRILILW